MEASNIFEQRATTAAKGLMSYYNTETGLFNVGARLGYCRCVRSHDRLHESIGKQMRMHLLLTPPILRAQKFYPNHDFHQFPFMTITAGGPFHG